MSPRPVSGDHGIVTTLAPTRGGPISTRGLAELHTHTTYSDGTLAPEQLVDQAAAAGLAALAITDHDIVTGVGPARRAAAGLALELVAGIEFSCNLDGREIHVLGLFIDENSAQLVEATERSRDFRRQRAAEIVERLHELDLPIELAAVEAVVGEGSIGRPHIAQALLDHGAVATLDEAFRRYIGVGRPAFTPKPTLGAEEVIGVVHRAGGVAILAHPASSRVREEEILQLAGLGLDGFEVIHPKHSTEASAWLRDLIQRTGLLPSGGSDYHGPGGGTTRLGEHAVSIDWLEALRAAAARLRTSTTSSKDEE
jgi:predicted metal-dependent phosphoesterase TrpH